ncbi:MAG: type II toxin-antitoxin system HicA family toxin [Firmicutes bacterium]|nr:type II toxin-antitoxin system HicA family toxin [Bacillota bacterium]
MKVRQLIRLLEEDGWQLKRTRGSRRQFQHPKKPGTVTVAGKEGLDIPPSTLDAILKRACARSLLRRSGPWGRPISRGKLRRSAIDNCTSSVSIAS